MIKVCHLTSAHSWNDTRIFYKECITLALSGYKVFLVAPNADEHIEDNIQILGVANNMKSRIYRASIFSFKIFLKSLKTKSKIYHFHDPEMIWVGVLLRLMGKKVIFDVHENVKAQIKDNMRLRFPKLTLTFYSFLEWLSSKLFYIIIAEDSYEEIFKEKAKSITKVLNFPIIKSLEPFRKPYKEKTENGILYVGLVSEARGIFEIMRALSILKSRKIDFVFHCVGSISDDMRLRIESNIDYLAVKDSVVFYGRLPVYEAYRYAENSKVALSILHPIPNYIRSYSTKIFEYMAIGIPFIVSDFPIYGFVKTDSLGYVVDPLNPQDIANQIENIFDNQNGVEDVINAGFKAVEKKFSWEFQSKSLIDLYSFINRK